MEEADPASSKMAEEPDSRGHCPQVDGPPGDGGAPPGSPLPDLDSVSSVHAEDRADHSGHKSFGAQCAQTPKALPPLEIRPHPLPGLLCHFYPFPTACPRPPPQPHERAKLIPAAGTLRL